MYQRAISQRFLRAQVKPGALVYDRILGLFAKPFYRVDVLLRFLNFFSSVYQVRQALSRKLFLLNRSPLKTPMFLVSGDVVEFKKQNPILLTFLRKKYSPKKKVLTFIEVDYYTKAVTVLKNSHELSPEEAGLLFFNKINFRSFRNIF
jgi:ribosomal protein S4